VTLLADRLIDARKEAGFKTARAAADALSIGYSTYASHENGSRKPKAEEIAQYARRFSVSLEWLLHGKNTGKETIVKNDYVPILEIDILMLSIEAHRNELQERDLQLDIENEAKNIAYHYSKIADQKLKS
jgi:transcriptional regulator with XRE-family HTH domain